jgi:hypothetical protein
LASAQYCCDRLNPGKDEADYLKQTLQINEPLATAYYQKKTFVKAANNPTSAVRQSVKKHGWNAPKRRISFC